MRIGDSVNGWIIHKIKDRASFEVYYAKCESGCSKTKFTSVSPAPRPCRGCQQYYRNKAAQAKRTYEAKTLAEFLLKRCSLGGRVRTSHFMRAYKEFAGDAALTNSMVGRSLNQLGFPRDEHSPSYRVGLSLSTEPYIHESHDGASADVHTGKQRYDVALGEAGASALEQQEGCAPADQPLVQAEA